MYFAYGTARLCTIYVLLRETLRRMFGPTSIASLLGHLRLYVEVRTCAATARCVLPLPRTPSVGDITASLHLP